jgi:hypothetical protein
MTPPPLTHHPTPPIVQDRTKYTERVGAQFQPCIRNSTPTLNINYFALLKIILSLKSKSQHKLSHTVRKNRLIMKLDFNINYPALIKITVIKLLYSNIHHETVILKLTYCAYIARCFTIIF